MKIKLVIPSNAKDFIRDYRLPLIASVAFIVLVMFLYIGRLHERATLGQVFSVNNSAGQDYASLFSNDKNDDFKKREVGNDENLSASGNSQPNVTSSSTSTTNTTPVTTQNTTQATSSTSPAGTSPPPVAVLPFFATITNFSQDQNASLQCPVVNINIAKCTKTYSFAAGIQSNNGPGTISYEWRYSVNGSSNGSYTAASGNSTSTLHNQITISCKDPVTFTAQFALTSPSGSQSQTLQITHSCK